MPAIIGSSPLEPSYLSKSGKHTVGVGYFHSGVAGGRKWGLEVTGLAAVDLEEKIAVQRGLRCGGGR